MHLEWEIANMSRLRECTSHRAEPLVVTAEYVESFLVTRLFLLFSVVFLFLFWFFYWHSALTDVLYSAFTVQREDGAQQSLSVYSKGITQIPHVWLSTCGKGAIVQCWYLCRSLFSREELTFFFARSSLCFLQLFYLWLFLLILPTTKPHD